MLLLNFKYDYDIINSNFPLFVRALPMYSAADWLKEPVSRCLQHLSPIDKLNQGKPILNYMFLNLINKNIIVFDYYKIIIHSKANYYH